MTDFEDRLVMSLERRASRVDVRDGLDAILSGSEVARLSPGPRRGALRTKTLAAAAVLIIGAGGLVWIQDIRSESPTADSSVESPVESVVPDPIATTQVDGQAGTGSTLDVTKQTPVSDQWSRLPDNDLTARSEHLLVATGSGLFVWGGYGTNQPGQETATLVDGAYYDNATKTWRTLPAAPLATDRGDAVGVWTGTEIVVMNGISGNVKSAAFNPTTFTWRALSDPPVDNAANGTSQAAFIDGQVVLFSVFEDGAAPQNQVARLDDVESGHWTVAPSPPLTLRSGIGIVSADRDAIVVGQTIGSGCGRLHLLRYTPATETWEEVAADPVANLAEPVVAWTGSELFVGGGSACDNDIAAPDPEARAHLLDPVTEQWRTATAAPTGFYSPYRYPDIWTGTSVATIDVNGTPLLYNPTTDTWHLGAPLNQPNHIAPNQTPIVASDNTLVISGGKITQNGELCCAPISGTYAYTIPEGY